MWQAKCPGPLKWKVYEIMVNVKLIATAKE